MESQSKPVSLVMTQLATESRDSRRGETYYIAGNVCAAGTSKYREQTASASCSGVKFSTGRRRGKEGCGLGEMLCRREVQ